MQMIIYLTQHFKNRNIIVNTITSDHQYLNSTWNYKQNLIFVNTARELNIIFQNYFFERKYSQSFLIVADNTMEAEEILEIMKRYQIYMSPLFTSYNKKGLLLHTVKHGCKGIPEVYSDIYNCSNPILLTKFRLFRNVKCSYKVGLRLTAPYVFKRTKKECCDSSYENQGTELLILKYIMHYLKHRIEIVSYNSPIIGHYDEKTKTSSGMIKELIEGRVDVILGAIPNTYSNLTESFYKSLYDIKIAIVKKRRDNELIKMISTYSWDVWLFTFILFLILNMFPYFVARFYNIPKLTDLVTFKLFTIIFGQSITFKKKHFRLLFLGWILFMFLLRSCYEARITSLFIDRDSSTQIDSLNEICEKKYTIFIDKYNKDIYKDIMEIPNCEFSSDQFVHVENPIIELLHSKLPLVAAFMYQEQYKWELGGHHKKVIQNLHIVKRQLGMAVFNFFSRPGEISSNVPLKPVTWLIEGGHLRGYKRFIDSISSTRYKDRSSNDATPLTLWQIRSVFMLYSIGVLVSFIFFVIEIITHKINLKINAK